MRISGKIPFRAAGGLIALAILTEPVNAYSLAYCSKQNSNTSYPAYTDIYNSYLACTGRCSDYAFALVQYQSCVCSNLVPSSTTDVSDCSDSCPAWQADSCGNAAKELWGYYAVSNNQPSGTAGSGQSSSSAKQTPSPSSSTQSSSSSSHTTQPSSFSSSSAASSTTSDPSDSSTQSSDSSSTTDSASSTHSVPPTVITVSGAPVTITPTQSPQPSTNKGISGGAIAGIVIGAVVGLAVILIGAFLLWRRNQSNDDSEKKGFKRTTSVLSKTGLLGGRARRPSVADGGDRATANSSVRHSALYGAGGATEDSHSPMGSAHDGDSGRRHSRPLVYDQRLNPSALFAHAEANGSRVSIQDQQDYSRPLGVTNPDPRASFESRVSHV